MSLDLIQDEENAEFSLDASPIVLNKSSNKLSQETLDEISLSLFDDIEDDDPHEEDGGWNCTTQDINNELNGVLKVKPIPAAGTR